MSADLSSEALGEGGSLGEGGGHPSLKELLPTTVHWLHAFLQQNKAPLGQHGAEGLDALQVPIKAPMAVSDLGGLQSLAAAEPIKAQPLAPCLFAAKQSSPRPARAGGPDALQVPIKAPMAVFDLEGYGPSQPRNQ